jgi:hypothetical protein
MITSVLSAKAHEGSRSTAQVRMRFLRFMGIFRVDPVERSDFIRDMILKNCVGWS